MRYTISKEKGSKRYYVRPDCSDAAIPGTHGDKKKALHTAAKMCGMSYKEYMKVWRAESGLF